ncbi:Fic/DOC family protein [Jeotgalibacillus haloalkalitolerans]|uniref:protein adenylyltransferase n=1 Tax=Jeotgalibacillus haloalkalitolerans TaxID=3104292 RepID=A0ABU5KQ69_9BACL|nr:Fic family protein [Jeotgalibacillus sp. HH7-29]MDZ5712845.1 Fic family protein [Jeotgalibacillus sp. HH7-29]
MDKYISSENDDFLLKYNLLGVTDEEALMEAEAVTFSLRAAEFVRKQYKVSSFDIQSFKDLHRHFFQDIYPFAGQFRTVQLMKGNTRFCQAQFLDSYAARIFEALAAEKDWTSLEHAAERLAYFKSELNMLHPFREGNGRTIRSFLHEYAWSKGIEWQYDQLDRTEYINAMIRAVTDLTDLERLFKQTISFTDQTT